MKNTYACCLLLALIFWNCKSQRYTVEDMPSTQLVFGNGGGITGAADRYTLLENGQCFHTNTLTGETEELFLLEEKEARLFFERLEALRLQEIDFDHPGNRYFFLESVKEGQKHTVTWGAVDHEVPTECKHLYTALIATLKKE